jgi:hypothetical protein
MILPDIPFPPPIPDPFSARLHRRLSDMRRDRRQRLLYGLYLLGCSSLAVGQELRRVLESLLFSTPDNGAIRRLFLNDLPELGLAERRLFPYINASKLAVLRLSQNGAELCRALGWAVIENEWQRLIREHRGEALERHTLGLLAFCYHARLRDWRVELLPAAAAYIEPDALVEKNGERAYVEFEVRPHGKLDKWRKSYQLQGFAAIATFTPASCAGFIQECLDMRLPVQAADLQSLAQTAHGINPGRLWLETYGRKR